MLAIAKTFGIAVISCCVFTEVEVALHCVTSEDRSIVAGENELVILDEADQLLLDNLLQLEANYCVGLTATPFLKLDGVEADYLRDCLRFKVFDSGIDSAVRSAQLMPVSSIEEFIRENAHRAKLIFGLPADEADIRALACDTKLNETNLAVTKNLSKTSCLLVTEETLMRGIDYRAEGCGIALLIANALTSDRALEQAKGRVGRYGEPCGRYKLSGFELLDE